MNTNYYCTLLHSRTLVPYNIMYVVLRVQQMECHSPQIEDSELIM